MIKNTKKSYSKKTAIFKEYYVSGVTYDVDDTNLEITLIIGE